MIKKCRYCGYTTPKYSGLCQACLVDHIIAWTFTLIIFMAITTGIVYFFVKTLKTVVGPDERTKELCRQWAATDHSGAVPPERLKWLKDQGVWDSFDWYGSCISEGEWLKKVSGGHND